MNPEGAPVAETSFRIVGIGASAGGLKAASDLLRHLPADLDMALVVVMHLDPNHPSSLEGLLERVCPLPVHEVTDGLELEPGHVYVIPPNKSLSVRGRALHLTPRTVSRRPPRPIDQFLRSLAEEHDGRGIGVILSGSGSDGTAGLQALKDAGGIAFAQDESADYADMPSSAVSAGCVDAVLSPESIAQELVRIGRHTTDWLYDAPAEDARPEERENDLDGLVWRLGQISGIDFIHYKQTTVRRRIQRRILLLGLERVDQYLAYFHEHPEEAETLCQDILIHVTGFFRDPEVFEMLGEAVFPAMMKERGPEGPIRIWLPGCATGQEVYSLAISLLEFLGQSSADVPIKLFGTDVSEQAVAVARTGRYSDSMTADVSPERLRRFFVREEGGHVITKAVRDLCVFARHDATRDPPFSDLDLISCRNLLIYLGPSLQKKVLSVFQYALRDKGHLLLGTAESISPMEAMFAAVDEHHSLYVRKPVPRRLPVELGASRHESGASMAVEPGVRAVKSLDVQREADRIVLAKYAPAGVLIDAELEILQFRGDTGAFLAPAPGSPSNSVLRMAREGLLPDLRAIIEEGKVRGVPIRREGLRIKADGREVHANLELHPIRIPGETGHCYAILFEETQGQEADCPAPATAPEGDAAGSGSEHIGRLERELVATREYLRANVERLEVANEELRAANEEILSSNEELRSTNEELQTAKEELQATNEELLTTNDELRHRNREVALLGDDLTNLLASVRIPIVMLGRDMHVRRFTPSAAKIFGISAADVGRSMLDLEGRFVLPKLEALLLEVLDTLSVAEVEIQDKGERWYSLCVRPYRTQDDRVDGIVLTLSDIDTLKRLAQKLEHARDFSEAVVMAVREPLLVLDRELSICISNHSFHDTFATTEDAVMGARLGEGATASWVTPKLLELLAETTDKGAAFADFVAEAEIPGRGARRLRLNARPVPGDGDREKLLLLAVEDVTDSELEQEEKERLSRKLQETQRLESLGVLAGGIAHDFNNILTAIHGFGELIQAKQPPDSTTFAHAGQIVQSAQRAADLCVQMLAYSGRGRFLVGALELSSLIEQAASLLQALVSKGANLHYDLTAGLPNVEADAAQLRQVLVNLVINASEALSERGGTIAVTTGMMDADTAYPGTALAGDVPAGEYVFLEVADDGCGMSPETQARIFDPFFTTKFTGRGLGLAAVLGIVRGHRGALLLNSNPGSGSVFRLLLPPMARQAPAEPAPSDAEGTAWKGTGTILVVDDEVDVRSLLRVMLPGLGLRVKEASSGSGGIEMLRACAEIDLVLLDLTMPGLGGAETFRAMRALRPDLRLILMSGYDEEEAVRHFPPSGLAGFLRKPFGTKDLAARLRQALAEGDGGDAIGPDGP